MEAIGNILDHLAWYHFFGIFVLFCIIFGKKKEWEFEAKLFEGESNQKKGEIEIEKFAKEPPQAELELYSFDSIKDKEIEIYLNETLISKFIIDEHGYLSRTIHPDPSLLPQKKLTTKGSDHKFNKIRFQVEPNIKPDNNDKVIVKANNTAILNGTFFRD